MKTLNISGIVLFLLLCSAVHAKTGEEIATQIAPLVNETTRFVAHADLSKINLDQICSESIKQIEPFLNGINLDEKSVKGISREATKLVAKGQKRVQSYLDGLVQESGITDVFFIAQAEIVDETNERGLAFLAFPLKNRSKTQQDALSQVLAPGIDAEYLSEAFELHGFQIIAISGGTREVVSQEQVEKALEQETIQSQKLLEEAFDQMDHSRSIRGIFLPRNDQLDKMLEIFDIFSAPTMRLEKDDETLSEYVELAKSYTKKTSWMSYVIDFSTWKYRLVVKANTEADAKAMEKDFDRSIFLSGELVKKAIAQEPDFAFFAPLASEFVKGFYETQKPLRDGDQFITEWESPMLFGNLLNFYVGIAHFALPPLEE